MGGVNSGRHNRMRFSATGARWYREHLDRAPRIWAPHLQLSEMGRPLGWHRSGRVTTTQEATEGSWNWPGSTRPRQSCQRVAVLLAAGFECPRLVVVRVSRQGSGTGGVVVRGGAGCGVRWRRSGRGDRGGASALEAMAKAGTMLVTPAGTAQLPGREPTDRFRGGQEGLE